MHFFHRQSTPFLVVLCALAMYWYSSTRFFLDIKPFECAQNKSIIITNVWPSSLASWWCCMISTFWIRGSFFICVWACVCTLAVLIQNNVWKLLVMINPFMSCFPDRMTGCDWYCHQNVQRRTFFVKFLLFIRKSKGQKLPLLTNSREIFRQIFAHHACFNALSLKWPSSSF